MKTYPGVIFDSFKAAAAASMQPSETNGSAGVGDSMKTFRSTSQRAPRWTAPNPSQATPTENPIAGQKIAPPPPVQ